MKRQWKECQIIVLIGIIIFGLIGLCNGSVPNCAHQLNGVMYPNNLDCASFWVCEYERPTLVHCDEGLFYDHKLKVCNWWFDVECVETPDEITTETPSTTVETTTMVKTTVTVPEITTAPEPETTAAPELETTTVPEITSAPEPETTAAPELETTRVPEITSAPEPETTVHPSTYPDCENANGQKYYPHLTEPSKYYICAGSFPVGLQCPAKFLWHQEYLSCLSTEIPEESCSQDEYTPHPDNEQYYYQCIDSKPILSLCPSNLKWNQDLLKCSEEAAVQPVYPNCNNTNGQIYFPHRTDVTKYYFCSGIYPVELPCPAKFQWYQVHERCVRTDIPQSEEELIDCSTEKYAPHPADEQMYLECVDNKPVISVCPSDLIWSQELLDCFRKTPDHIKYPQCNNPMGQIYFPHLTETSKYYICAGDFAIELSCPASFDWYQNYQSCATTELPEGEEEIIDCKSNEQQYAPHSFDEQIYYRCIDETPVQMLCPGNLRWNQELFICTDELPPPKYPQCDNPSGQIFFPHLTDSSKYYICAGNFPIELGCPSSFEWIQDHQSCATTDITEEELTVIDCSLEGGPRSAPKRGNQQFYYLCVAEKPVLMLCPSDFKWDNILKKCTDEITPEPVYPQCLNPDGQVFFPHLTDPSKYYVCAGNFAVELPCPSVFIWSQDYQSCARIETPAEEQQIIDCLSENKPFSAPYKEDDQLYYICIAERPILMLCPSDLKWDQVQKICTDEINIEPQYPQCDNPAGQIYFPHLTDPGKYYICAGSFSIELPCPTSFLWSQDHQSCARINNSEEEEENVIDCLLENGPQTVSHPDNDQLYYLCIAERPVMLMCPSDLKWDQHLETCTETGTLEPVYPQCENSGEDKYFAHLTDSNKYYGCNGTIPYELACPINYVWSQDYQSCKADETPEEEYPLECNRTENREHMSHPSNSQKYFFCMDRRPALLHCPSITNWDDKAAKCLLETEAVSSYPPCGNGPIFYPHLTDPKQYYLCSGYYALTMTCENDYIWSTVKNTCIQNIPIIEEPDCEKANGKINLPHPTNPKKYYICLGVTPLEMECPGETIWDTTLDTCMVRVYPNCSASDDLIYYPHLENTNQYYECSDNKATLFSCPGDSVWNNKYNSCFIAIDESAPISCTDGKADQTHYYPNDNKKYYICAGEHPYLMECPGHYIWKSSSQQCDMPKMTILPSIPSAEFSKAICSTGKEFLTNYQNCHKYYICIGGIMALEFTCEKDTYWDPVNVRCSEEKSNCFLK